MPKGRIAGVFSGLRATGARAFMPFVVAGDPDLATTARVIETLDGAGCQLCEVGFPFSDPVADGPVIQAAFTRALQRGIRVDDIFRMVGEVAGRIHMPLIGMVSYTLVHRRGLEPFVEQAAAAGFAGLIVPDLPGEEAAELAGVCDRLGLDLIPLVTPTTAPERAARICTGARGFIYCVAVAGVTGERSSISAGLGQQMEQLRKLTPLPLCAGFGISTPEQARLLREIADGVIVGSAVTRRMESMTGNRETDQPLLAGLGRWCREFVEVLA
jgi:tryptophan synthase alpha chain